MQSHNRVIRTAGENRRLSCDAQRDGGALQPSIALQKNKPSDMRNESTRLLAAIQSGVVCLDGRGRVTRWNPAAERLLGVPAREALRRRFASLPIAWQGRQSISALLAGPLPSDGTCIEAAVLSSAGNSRTLRLSICPLSDGSTQQEVLLQIDDVSDRCSLEQQLHRSQKLESLGHLASGIAHEINNPMQYVGDNIQFLKVSLARLRPTLELLRGAQRQQLSDEGLAEQLLGQLRSLNLERMLDDLPQAVDDSEHGVRHVSRIVRAMKEFSHPGTEAQLPVDLNQVLESTLVVSKSEWKFVADVETSFQHDLPKVAGFGSELHQVFLNLVVNAAHAIASANAIAERTKGLIRVATVQTGDYCTVSIQDNGGGIPREIEHRIFDPFFTTKEVGKGTGQGLTIARRVVVEKHGGSMWFDSVPGQGTTFYVQLARAR